MKYLRVAIGAAMMSAISMGAAASGDQPSWLFVQTATGFTFDGNSSITIPYEREVFGFTDRPYRMHAYLNAHETAALWESGEDDFSQDPPNAVLTWVLDGDVQEAEVELLSAAVDDLAHSMTYSIRFEAGDPLPEEASLVSLFIDGWYDPVSTGPEPCPNGTYRAFC